jgi:uncharacterized protein YoxC
MLAWVDAIWTSPVLLLTLIPVLALAMVCHRCVAWCLTINAEVHVACDREMHPLWTCCLSRNVMTDPVKACDKSVYERSYFADYCERNENNIKRRVCPSPMMTAGCIIYTDQVEPVRLLKLQILVWNYSPAIVKAIWCMLKFGTRQTWNQIYSRFRSPTLDVILGSICASISVIIIHLLLCKYTANYNGATVLSTILSSVTLVYMVHSKRTTDEILLHRFNIVNANNHNLNNTLARLRDQVDDIDKNTQGLSDQVDLIGRRARSHSSVIDDIDQNTQGLRGQMTSLQNHVSEISSDVNRIFNEIHHPAQAQGQGGPRMTSPCRMRTRSHVD